MREMYVLKEIREERKNEEQKIQLDTGSGFGAKYDIVFYKVSCSFHYR